MPLKNFKGTQGELRIEAGIYGHQNIYAGNNFIMTVNGRGKHGPSLEDKANAKLFAASKDMAEALQAFVEAAEETTQLMHLVENGRAALSKALD